MVEVEEEDLLMVVIEITILLKIITKEEVTVVETPTLKIDGDLLEGSLFFLYIIFISHFSFIIYSFFNIYNFKI